MEASAEEQEEEKSSFIELSRVTVGELLGMLAGLALLGSLFLPWFSTSEANENSIIKSAGATAGESASAWQTFPILRWLLLAACVAPFILTWIVLRGHELTWKPGEVTMLVGMVAFVLILCNGIILGKPEPGIELSLSYGYPLALIAAGAMTASGFLRQALNTDAKKPPGVL